MVVPFGRLMTFIALVLAIGACSSDDDSASSPGPPEPASTVTTGSTVTTDSSTSFCEMSRQAIAETEAALETLTAGGGDTASLQQSQGQLLRATNTMIQALQSPPPDIAGEAPVAIRQIRGFVESSTSNTPAPTPTPEEQAANEAVDNYLQNTCGIQSTNLFVNR